jgi:excisionase family DNA binding protein
MANKPKRLNPLDGPILTAEEAFALLRIDRSTGYKSIKDGTFPLPVVRIGRVIRIPTAPLLRFLDSEPEAKSQLPTPPSRNTHR